jgi:probable phosphoglycerate mutase
MPAETVDLTLLRHGESTYNAQGLYQGALDLPVLTPKGRSQAKAAALLLRSRFDALWVSPLARAAETASSLVGFPPLPAPQTVDALREIHLPEWEGRAFADVKREDPARHRQWKFAPESFEMRTSEGNAHFPARDALDRARKILDRALACQAGTRVLCVTHGGMIRAHLVAALGMDPNLLHGAILDNCSFARLSLSPKGRHRLMSFNLRSHRPALASGDKPLIIFTPTSQALQVLTHFPGSALLDLRFQRFDPELAVPSGVIVHGEPAQIENALQQLLGMSGQGHASLCLAPDMIHVAVQRTDSNPAALWLMNQPVPALTHIATPSIQEVF